MKRPNKQTAKDAALKSCEMLSKKLLVERGITEARMFGGPVFKANGKVFAFPFKGNFVFKLPENRVVEIIALKQGELFDPGHGRTSKTWVAVFPEAKTQWLKLAREAKEFVLSQKK